jgi:DnaJ family protein C protein 7
VRLNSQNPDALYLRARVFYGQGDNAKVVAHCTEALRCDPDFSKARTLLKMARAIDKKKEEGNVAFKTGRLDEAYEAYTAALEIDPENAHMNSRLYSNRAAVLQKVCLKEASFVFINIIIFLAKKIRRCTTGL